ncbi:MAG TPA: hypothetical protein VFV57_05605, partial [Limnobacter sp.]|nr:hypothetical protein [Limnobacter sp.]
NTQFKAEQVNTAIAIGLIQRNPNNTSQLILTTNGNGYYSAKNPNTQPSTQTPPTSTQAQQVTEQDRADAFLAAVQSFPSWTSTITDRGMQRTIRLNAFDVLDSAHRGHGDGQFGSSDIDIVARRSGDTPSRRLAALARYAQQYGILDYIARNSGPGQRYSGVFNDGYIHRGMDNYVRSLPADRVTLVYTTAADGSVTITERR